MQWPQHSRTAARWSRHLTAILSRPLGALAGCFGAGLVRFHIDDGVEMTGRAPIGKLLQRVFRAQTRDMSAECWPQQECRASVFRLAIS
jgi:hypothetical protein